MRAVVQRVSGASVAVDGNIVGKIDQGLLVLLGAGAGDTDNDLQYIVDKLVNLRIFADLEGKMNLSVLDVAGGVLVVSQFTLFGDARKGRRPAFTSALEPVEAKRLYERSLALIRAAGVTCVAAGIFAADMKVSLVNDGPITILLDSTKLF
jgi:D-aminoacyl-tRNA deacylase